MIAVLSFLTEMEKKAVLNFVDRFTSVSLCPQVVGKRVVDIVKKVNQHRHTKACRKYQTCCRFSFPKFPVWRSIITNPNHKVSESEKVKFEKILSDVKDFLLDQDIVNEIMQSYDKSSESKHEYFINRKKKDNITSC